MKREWDILRAIIEGCRKIVQMCRLSGSLCCSNMWQYPQYHVFNHSRDMRFPTMWNNRCYHQRLRPACVYTQYDQSLCLSLEYSMSVTLLTEHHLEFRSLKGGCTGSSKFIHVKMPHCWISHVKAIKSAIRMLDIIAFKKWMTACQWKEWRVHSKDHASCSMSLIGTCTKYKYTGRHMAVTPFKFTLLFQKSENAKFSKRSGFEKCK